MSHDHSLGSNQAQHNIKIVLLLNLFFAVFELVGGYFFNSFAVITDALHDFGDAGTLAIAFFLQRLSVMKASQRYSYGYKRLSLLSAIVSALVLISATIIVTWFALMRIQEPSQPISEGVMVMAILGIVINAYSARRLHAGATLNEEVLSWHMIEDVFGWVLVLISGIVIYFEGPLWIDPVVSLILAGVILWGCVRSLLKSVRLFLQGSPANIDLEGLKSKILQLDRVEGVHDVHLWSLDGQSHVLSMHVVTENFDFSEDLRRAIREQLKSFGQFHSTIEVEVALNECESENCGG
jgi:cobalt-zinc-cadmium efflux system protein